MALQGSGAIKYSEIEAEFGRSYANQQETYTVPWVKWTPQAAWVLSRLGGGNASTPNWSQFLVDYGVYPSNTDPLVGTHTGVWRIFFPAGSYTIEVQADNTAVLKLDGSTLGSTVVTNPQLNSAFYSFTVTEDQHYIEADVTNVDNGQPWVNNPAGVAWKITKDIDGSEFANSTQGFNYSVASTGWGSLLNTYGVYPSATDPLLDTAHTTTYVIEPTSSGNLTFEISADHEGSIKLDGTLVISQTGDSNGSTTTTTYVEAGRHTLEVTVTNITSTTLPSNTWFHNPGAVAFTIKDTSGSIIKSSLDVGLQGSFTEGSGAYSLGNYRVNASYGGISFPLDTNAGADSDTNIPQSGAIKFSDFYNGRLNMLVNYFGQDETRPEKGSTRYNDPAAVIVVGGFKERPNSTTGKKVHLVVGKTIGSKKWESSGEETKCAIRTGTWDSDTKLVVDVGPTAKVFGAGGDGGQGQRHSQNGLPGKSGTSAIGIEHEGTGNTEVNIRSGGVVASGFGGGGGSGGGRGENNEFMKDESDRVVGSGGGGGQGIPAGQGGGSYDPSRAGQDGTADEGGEGGAGATGEFGCFSNAGGDGGETTVAAQAGGTGGDEPNTSGGAAGAAGAAIRKSGGITLTITNNGTVYGSTSASGVT